MCSTILRNPFKTCAMVATLLLRAGAAQVPSAPAVYQCRCMTTKTTSFDSSFKYCAYHALAMWHTWTLLCYTAESCDHGWLTKLLRATEPDKGHIVASVIKLTALVAHVPSICSERCMGDVHDTVMWPRSALLFIIYEKKAFVWWGRGVCGWGFDWYVSQLQVGGTSAGQGPERSMLCYRSLLRLINDCLRG